MSLLNAKENSVRLKILGKPKSRDDKIFETLLCVLMFLLMLLCAYPVYYVLVASISDSTAVNNGQMLLWPQNFHTLGYQFVMKDNRILTGYGNTILYTGTGTILGLFCSLLAGYSLSRKDLPGRGFIMAVMVFTMYFSGGMIPSYLVVKTLGLTNTRWIMILLGSISVYNIILIRTFFSSNIATELQEAAFIDGCSNTRFFFQFVLPLSKAIIAVIALYLAVGYWNGYFNGLLYLVDRNKYPLQMFVREMILTDSTGDIADGEMQSMMNQMVSVIKYAVIVVSTLPIMCLYPFLQKYFVQGVMIGSLKG